MNQQPGVFGKKLGMTQIFGEDGNIKRVTVVETGPLVVVGKRTVEKDGYAALVLGLGERKEKHTNKALAGAFKKANVTPKRDVKELRTNAEFIAKFEIGATIKLDEVFEVGQYVDAQGVSKGHGFTGVMRRHGFAGGVGSHGTHEYFRHGGSIGTNMTPGRTLPNVRMGGHMGDETVSIQNVKVARIDAEKNLLLIEGGIPGARNSLVLIRKAVKARGKGGAKAVKLVR
jgi:large subunit ribosomal protein L3